MTYCVGIRLSQGLVLLSDTRTNAGLDDIARFRKMFTWEVPGERVVALMVSGNLSITQGILTRINAEIAKAAEDPAEESILNAASIFRVGEMVGEAMRAMQDKHRDVLEAQGVSSRASVIVAGQRAGGRHRLFLVYSAGNFMEATEDTPFLQIGEHKYGKPILDRVIRTDTSIGEALKAACVSMDSTLRSNLSVGMPLDLAVIEAGAFRFAINRRIEADDAAFGEISRRWSDALRQSFHTLPTMGWD